MKTWQKILFPIVLVGIVALIILTWGSIASIIFAAALFMALPVWLFNRTLNNDEWIEDFRDDPNN